MRWPLLRVAVAERSMEPALRQGDWLVAWRGAPVRPGHIVVARHPEQQDLLLVKRAVARHADGWWLMSDNRDVAAVDSRRFGPVASELIEGRVLCRYWRARRGRT